MSDADFYNLNLYRRYPLVDEAVVASDDGLIQILADLGIVLEHDSGFDLSDPSHRVYVVAYGLSGGMPMVRLMLSCPGASADGDTITVVSSSGDMYQFQPFTADYGYGWVVFGDPAAFPSVVVDIESAVAMSPDSYPHVERRCIQTPRNHRVSSISIANELRTSVDGPFGYEFASLGRNMVGDIVLMPGYNCHIQVLEQPNAIRIVGRIGGGEGRPCELLPMTSIEADLLSSSMALDGALGCGDAVYSVNGIQPVGGSFTIRGGRGIAVDSPEAHHVRISPRDDLTGNCA